MTQESAAAAYAAPTRRAAAPASNAPLRKLYLALSEAAPDAAALAAAADWLAVRLQESAAAASSLPAPGHGAAFTTFLAARQDEIDEQYKQYVAERRAGAPRRMFSGRAHALYYLKAIAPTRLTDGAWLYGALARWDEPAMRPLIATYLEELGNGVPDKNHVVIFQQLIDAHGSNGWQRLAEHHFDGGLTQLTLAHHAERFFPELIGYNLGAERADLDAQIAAYELNELGIDPYYFTLHVSADNSITGHASLALDALRSLTPNDETTAGFLRRVDAGYRLHHLAADNAALLSGFALRAELEAALAVKNVALYHPANTVRIGARALPEWFGDSEAAPQLLELLESEGWLVRGEDAAASRLWALIESADPATPAEALPLASLFTEYELALLADWAATPSQGAGHAPVRLVTSPPRRINPAPPAAPERVRESAERGIIRHRFPDDEHGWEALANELSLLEARIVASNSKEEAIALLAALMGPARHHASTGLMATRMFSQLFAA
ncbi:MAG: iron-containing redox enzyme family protein [Massilia sp.]